MYKVNNNLNFRGFYHTGKELNIKTIELNDNNITDILFFLFFQDV